MVEKVLYCQKKKGCKIPGYTNVYANSVGNRRFKMCEFGKNRTYLITKPVTRTEAKRMGFPIPKGCKG